MASKKVPDQLYVEGRTYQGVHKESNGYKLLASMGWKEGEGLGMSGQGIKEHISVKKKNDSLGIGQAKSQNRDEDWLLNMSMFDKVLSNLKEVKTEHKNSSNGAAELKDKGKVVSKKKRKVSKCDPQLLNEKDSEAVSKRKKKVIKRKPAALVTEGTTLGKSTVSHVGRFRRQEESKSVSRYSAGDLSAILGGTALNQIKTQAGTISVEEPEVTDNECESPGNESEADKWWAVKFTRAGTLQKPKKSASQVQNRKVQIKVHGFSETDQTNLYTQVQDAATSGRQGLGTSSVRKVSGAKISQGKQITFSSDDESDQANERMLSKPSADSQKGDGLSIDKVAPTTRCGLSATAGKTGHKKPKMKSRTTQHVELDENCSNHERIKSLRRLASKTLKVHGGQLKIAKLCRLVKKELISTESKSTCCLDELKIVLETSKKIKVDGKLAIKVK